MQHAPSQAAAQPYRPRLDLQRCARRLQTGRRSDTALLAPDCRWKSLRRSDTVTQIIADPPGKCLHPRREGHTCRYRCTRHPSRWLQRRSRREAQRVGKVQQERPAYSSVESPGASRMISSLSESLSFIGPLFDTHDEGIDTKQEALITHRLPFAANNSPRD
ncbi:unnamed protein product [Mycena citricolor]|uniref:Uncharacterized protein n=1 Tax=Mycena citricolor TaxID=2018698 RepID=A0AAD2HPH8_9AGAR|nr:unnamed protein product [Mycena citricolor]